MFIILRSEIVNHSNFVTARVINTSKVIITVTGVALVTATTILSYGGEHDFYACVYEINQVFVISMGVFDAARCAAGT
jgi:hypothetical protein